MYGTKFSGFLKEKRKSQKTTVREMAKLSDLSAGDYCEIESGRCCPPERETLDKITNALNLTKEERILIYKLAEKARSKSKINLSEYINDYEMVHVAFRMKNHSDYDKTWNIIINCFKLGNRGFIQ